MTSETGETGEAGEAGSMGAAEATSFTQPTSDSGEPPDTADPPLPPLPPGVLRFAVIGDFGLDGAPEASVAARVSSWDPALVLTVGDNNYFTGAAETIDANIGKHYRGFIAPYVGGFGVGAAENRFFPCPGNHDWQTGSLQAYLDYFTLPGNERYYSVRRGEVEFFMLDSDYREPDGLTPTQAQGQWLEAALAGSDASFRVVAMHHAPHSSGLHGGLPAMRWPYADWGADLVLAGHDHDYERLVVDGLPYVVVGTSGAALRKFVTEAPGSQRGHADGFGALRIEASASALTVDFVDDGGARIDRLTLAAAPPTSWQTRVPRDSTWRYLERDPGPGWSVPEFVAEDWISGAAPLGFGVGGEATLLAGGEATKRPITTYFRHRFIVGAEDLGPWLRLRLAVDDAAIVYLNGTEVYRIDLREGPVDDATTAALPVGDWFPGRLSETLIAGDALRGGDNVLAVEVHQHAATSSDLRLELELAVAGG